MAIAQYLWSLLLQSWRRHSLCQLYWIAEEVWLVQRFGSFSHHCTPSYPLYSFPMDSVAASGTLDLHNNLPCVRRSFYQARLGTECKVALQLNWSFPGISLQPHKFSFWYQKSGVVGARRNRSSNSFWRVNWGKSSFSHHPKRVVSIVISLLLAFPFLLP